MRDSEVLGKVVNGASDADRNRDCEFHQDREAWPLVDPERVASSLIASDCETAAHLYACPPKASVARHRERLSTQISNGPMAAVRLKVSILTEPPAPTLFPAKRRHNKSRSTIRKLDFPNNLRFRKRTITLGATGILDDGADQIFLFFLS